MKRTLGSSTFLNTLLGGSDVEQGKSVSRNNSPGGVVELRASDKKRAGKTPVPPARRHVRIVLSFLSILAACWVFYEMSSLHKSTIDKKGLAPEPVQHHDLDVLALERVAEGGKHSTTPVGPTLSHGGPAYVEFTAPGLYIDIKKALTLDIPVFPQEVNMLNVFPLAGNEGEGLSPKAAMGGHMSIQDYMDKKQALQMASLKAKEAAENSRRALLSLSDEGGGPEADNDRDSPKGIRLLVGVTSACCSQKALERRAAVRSTWVKTASEYYNTTIDVKFFLAQPPDAETAEKWAPILEQEVLAYNDTVIVRGKEKYMNFPNKTIRLLRFMLMSAKRYTHVLKTDDDCFVRFGRLLEALHEALPPPGVSTSAVAENDQEEVDAERISKEKGLPVHTDGMATYDGRNIINANRTLYIDKVNGDPMDMKELAARSNKDKEVAVERGNRKLAQAVVIGGQPYQFTPEGMTALPRRPRLSGVYMGCVENKGGFSPIRDPKSKWYVSPEDLPNSAVPHGVKYAAGWGYVLSRDFVDHAVRKVNLWENKPETAPAWYFPLHWEDVLIGMLLMDVVDGPQDHPGFRAAWRSCPNDTAVRHLDVDAPALMSGLYEQDRSGLWDLKPIQCSSGSFLPGDYNGWRKWRDELDGVSHLR